MKKKTGVRVGQATLKSQLALREMAVMRNVEIKRVLKAKVWNLGTCCLIGVSKVDELWRNVLGCIDSSINTQLWVHVNQRQNIITEINHIRFPYLLQLFLGFNCIRSIEALARIDAPLLHFLSVRYNSIVEVKTLRKTHLFVLATLWLDGNSILVGNSLNELKQPEKIENLCFQDSKFNSSQNEDERVVVKLEARQMQLLDFKSERRVKQQRCRQMLGHRFLALQINSFD